MRVSNIIHIQDEWPEGYFERVFGQWQGEPLDRPPQGEFETRAILVTRDTAEFARVIGLRTEAWEA